MLIRFDRAVASLRTSLAVVCLALSACGGGGSDAPSAPPAPAPATVQAVPDVATVGWNAATDVDVLANDSASRGALVLHGVSAGGQGQVEIAGGKLRYTPAAGFIGTETVSYTVRATEGGALADATLSVTVEAVLRLSGVASAAPLSNAQVTARVGTQSYTATTDAQGAYTIDVRSARPDDFVTLTASGTGSQSAVVLTSLVGAVADLAGSAQAGAVAASRMPALNLTPVSTAVAALAERRGSKVLPATTEQLRQTTATLMADEVLRAAAVVRLVAHGAALPAGQADTLQLLRNEAAFEAFLQAYEPSAPAAELEASKVSVLREMRAGSGPLLPSQGPRTIAYLSGDVWTSLLVTYRPDGTATVYATALSPRAASELREATWQQVGTDITLAFATPIGYQVAENEGMGALLTTGVVLKQVTGDASAGLAVLTQVGTALVDDNGPNHGKPLPAYQSLYDGTPYRLMTVIDLDRRLPIDSTVAAPGRRLGGVLTMRSWIANDRHLLGVLRLNEGGLGIIEETGAGASWSVADRWLTVQHGGYPTSHTARYARLAHDETTGEERWIALVAHGNVDTWSWPVRVIVADPDPAFTAGSAARDWHPTYASLLQPTPGLIRLFADGTFTRGGRAGTWVLDGAGGVTMKSLQWAATDPLSVDVHLIRTWTPLKRRGDRVWMLQTIGFDHADDSGSSAVVWFSDRGPAVK